jgi:putative phosphoribosyl transferase
LMWPPEEERFADRAEAGRVLGAAVACHLKEVLGDSVDTPPKLVMGLPRGGVPIGYEVAHSIDARFDLVVWSKIGLPWQADFGVGAMAEFGPPVFDRDALAGFGLNVSDLTPVVQRQRADLTQRQQRWRGHRPPPVVTGHMVVVVDDGLATSVTVRAALRGVRSANPAYLVFAAPVCAAETADLLAAEADAVVCVHSPREFHALGLWYRDFSPVTDRHVAQVLALAGGTAPVP